VAESSPWSIKTNAEIFVSVAKIDETDGEAFADTAVIALSSVCMVFEYD
jgi:hypothetical protein